MSKLALALGPPVSEATGQNTLALRLINHGVVACVLDGYPNIRLMDRGRLVPFVIRHGGDQMITAAPPKRVVVRPDRAAFLLINHYRCDLGSRRGATRVKVALASANNAETRTITVPGAYGRLSYCGKGDPGSVVTVSPFEPNLRAALSG